MHNIVLTMELTKVIYVYTTVMNNITRISIQNSESGHRDT